MHQQIIWKVSLGHGDIPSEQLYNILCGEPYGLLLVLFLYMSAWYE
jgi:hypothetical protein